MENGEEYETKLKPVLVLTSSKILTHYLANAGAFFIFFELSNKVKKCGRHFKA